MRKCKATGEQYLNDSSMQDIRARHSDACRSQLTPMHISNFLYNVRVARYYPGIMGFEHSLKRMPAVLVGAGPSLTKQVVRLLEKYKENIIILAVDAALPVLVGKYKVNPHFVVMVDPTEKQRHNFKDIDTTQFYTIVPSIVHPSIFRIVDPQHLAMYSIKDPSSEILELAPYHTGRKGGLPAGVLTSGSALAFAAICGCDPLIFVGHDLSWPTPDKVYAEGIADVKVGFQKGTKFRGNCLLFPDINGEMVLTHETFICFWAWCKQLAHRMKQRVINCSGAGILKSEDIKVMDLQGALTKYASKKLEGVGKAISDAYMHESKDGLAEKLLTPPFKKI